jgi:hypothetical protein
VARTHQVSIAIYRLHLAMFRYLNDAWIFTALARPELKHQSDALLASKSKTKRSYPVPKKDRSVTSRRTDKDVGDVFKAQYERGIFETQIISIVSRIEAFIQDCLFEAIRFEPKKLPVLGDRGIPIDLFLAHKDRDDLLESLVAQRCQDLMFGKPADYLAKVQKVLSIEIDNGILAAYIEMKASRDVIIHNGGRINQIYKDKALTQARGDVGEELVIDADYFGDVIINTKLLSGAIQRETEKTYR